MLKNLIQKVVDFAAEHSTTVKEQLDAYKGIQKALSDTESFKATEVDVVNWALDEAAKCQTRIHGFKLVLGTSADIDKLVVKTQVKTKESFMKKIGIFGRIGKVEMTIEKVANFAAASALSAFAGCTFCTEVDNEEDAIYIYVEQLHRLWWQLAKRGESIEEIVRQTVRHEFRHAEQILAMRKVGGSDLVKRMMDLEMETAYNDRIMEKDAWSEQHLDHYRPIEEFIKEAVEAVH